MCLLVYKQPDRALPVAHATAAARSNNDGFGVAYHDGQRWVLHRTLDLLEHLRALPDATPYPALVHYRMATHGTVSLDNVHPFLVGEPDDPHAFVVAHNGMFTGLPRDAERSDTRLMVDHVFSWLKPGWADDVILRQQLAELFRWNKVAVLFPDGSRVLFGEREGHWHDDVWYSNSSYRAYAPSASTALSVATQVIGKPPRPSQLLLLDDVVAHVNEGRHSINQCYCADCFDEVAVAGRQYYDAVTMDDLRAKPYRYGHAQCFECGKALRTLLIRAVQQVWGD